MAKCYVKAYFDWIEQTAALSDAERGRLFIAILEYARSGLEPKLDGRESILFPVFRATIDRDGIILDARAKNGALGGKANRSKTKQTEANGSEDKPNKDIRHKKKGKDIRHKTQENNAGEDAFLAFWDAYPRKAGKQDAKKAFGKVTEPLEKLLDAIEQQKKSKQWQRDDGQYIPYPATWLNQGRWEDDLNGESTGGAQKSDRDRSLEEFMKW